MKWRDMAEEGFPPPHDDEPSDLRSQILDELSDHLACAMKRELGRTDDEEAAERAVLERFGDPVRLARQLWFDWMKEKIMRDRILMVLVGLMVVASVATAAFAWRALAQNQRINETMLARLEALATRPAADLPQDWSKASISLIKEGSGEPIEGRNLSIKGKAFSEESVHLNATTNEKGIASFGPIRPGRYEIVNLSEHGFRFGGQGNVGHTAQWLTLYPGQELERTIVCPSFPRARVSFDLDWGGQEPSSTVLMGMDFLKAGNNFVLVDEIPWYYGGQSLGLTSDDQVLSEFGRRTRRAPRGGRTTMVMTTRPETIDALEWPAVAHALGSLTIGCPAAVPDDGVVTEWQQCASYRWGDESGSPAPMFEIDADQMNRLTIPIPEEVIAEVRRALAGDENKAEG